MFANERFVSVCHIRAFCLTIFLKYSTFSYQLHSLFPERATDGSLQSEDWTLNMEICDIINETEDG